MPYSPTVRTPGGGPPIVPAVRSSADAHSVGRCERRLPGLGMNPGALASLAELVAPKAVELGTITCARLLTQRFQHRVLGLLDLVGPVGPLRHVLDEPQCQDNCYTPPPHTNMCTSVRRTSLRVTGGRDRRRNRIMREIRTEMRSRRAPAPQPAG